MIYDSLCCGHFFGNFILHCFLLHHMSYAVIVVNTEISLKFNNILDCQNRTDKSYKKNVNSSISINNI